MKFAGKPLVLMLLDGWGMPEHTPTDATCIAKLPAFHSLWQKYPHTVLGASGTDVGLPAGQMGDSEVGHMNIGAGRIMYQDYTLINRDIDEGTFFNNETFISACRQANRYGGAMHLFGLTSDGGIHSHINHLIALMRLCKQQQIQKLFIHCFTDGRDTNSGIAQQFTERIEQEIKELKIGKIATVCGRFYAMDRDKRWERVHEAYEALVYGRGRKEKSAAEAIRASYARGDSDEFIEPTVIVDNDGQPVGLMKSGDSAIFFNYRSDRAREISHAFTDKVFDFFDRGPQPPRLFYVCFTNYDDTLENVEVAYSPRPPRNTVSRVISKNGLRQLRIAETEKYAHVTFFFNGGIEKIDVGEDRVMIPSPNVKTYDKKPEMSAGAVTKAVIDRIRSSIYDVIVINYANPDMVGHTGNLEATVKALEYIDNCIAQVMDVVKDVGGTLIITADHGNVERMTDEHCQPMTSHTTNNVPFILVDDGLLHLQLREGRLEDIAPTMLQLLGIKQPDEMTGSSLIISGLKHFDQLELNFG